MKISNILHKIDTPNLPSHAYYTHTRQINTRSEKRGSRDTRRGREPGKNSARWHANGRLAIWKGQWSATSGIIYTHISHNIPAGGRGGGLRNWIGVVELTHPSAGDIKGNCILCASGSHDVLFCPHFRGVVYPWRGLDTTDVRAPCETFSLSRLCISQENLPPYSSTAYIYTYVSVCVCVCSTMKLYAFGEYINIY